MTSCFTLPICLSLLTASQADEQAHCQELVAKAVKALGGDANVEKLQGATWKSKGKYKVNEGVEVSFSDEGAIKGDRWRVDLTGEVTGMTFKEAWVLNGDKGWLKESISNDKVTELPKELLSPIKECLHAVRLAQMPVALKNKSFSLSPLGEIKVGTEQAAGLRITQKGHRDVCLYFDKKTGLPLKSEVRIQEWKGQEVSYEFLFTDYKDHDGLTHFSKLVVKRDGMQFLEAELTELKAKLLDDSAFDKP